MKEEEKEDIVSEVKSGQFFTEALDWYNQLYIYPVIQRTSLITITLMCIITNSIAYYALYNFLPLVKPFSVGIVNPDETEYYAEVIKLTDPVFSEQEVIYEYLAKFYVTARETYAFSDLQRNLDVVRNMSTRQLYDAYSRYMNINNPSSPVLRYRQNTSVNISNLKFILEPASAESKPDRLRAKIYFDRVEKSATASRNEKWVATMTFASTSFNYDPIKKTFPKINFKVIDYKAAVARQQNAPQPAGAQKAR